MENVNNFENSSSPANVFIEEQFRAMREMLLNDCKSVRDEIVKECNSENTKQRVEMVKECRLMLGDEAHRRSIRCESLKYIENKDIITELEVNKVYNVERILIKGQATQNEKGLKPT